MNVSPSVLGSIILTAACWGVYGPLLHWGQLGFEGSRLRAFLCVGIAYFIIAVVVPLVLIQATGEKGVWHTKGLVWSLVAGSAGAIGALGIILAFNFGGKPVFVMPLVFGCAPIINALFTISTNNLWGEVKPAFLIGCVIVAVGAVMVLKFAPSAHPPKPAAPAGAVAPETPH